MACKAELNARRAVNTRQAKAGWTAAQDRATCGLAAPRTQRIAPLAEAMELQGLSPACGTKVATSLNLRSALDLTP
ncbi:hypothetical protein CYMTET_35890, partial [Cymbomonas tetramitiformis]